MYGAASSDKTAVLLGDSMAISYLPGIRAALEPLGWRIQVYTMQQCPAATVTVRKSDDSAHPQCDPFREWALAQVAAQSPDLVILSEDEGRLAENRDGLSASARWRAGTDATLTRLAGAAARTVILSRPPGGRSLSECATRSGSPADCVRPVPREWSAKAEDESESAAAHGPTVTAVDTMRWFCSPNGSCPAFVGTTPVYVDSGHLTDEYSRQLGPVLHEVLLEDTATT